MRNHMDRWTIRPNRCTSICVIAMIATFISIEAISRTSAAPEKQDAPKQDMAVTGNQIVTATADTAGDNYGNWVPYPNIAHLAFRVRQGDIGTDGRRFWFWQFRNQGDAPVAFAFAIGGSPPTTVNALKRHYRLAARQIMEWESGDYLAGDANCVYSAAQTVDMAIILADGSSPGQNPSLSVPGKDTPTTASMPEASDITPSTDGSAAPIPGHPQPPRIKAVWRNLDLLAQMVRFLLPSLSGKNQMKGVSHSLALLQQCMDVAWRAGDEKKIIQLGYLAGTYTQALAQSTSARGETVRRQGVSRLNAIADSLTKVAVNPTLLNKIDSKTGTLPSSFEPVAAPEWELPAPDAIEPTEATRTVGGAYEGPHRAQVNSLLSNVEFSLGADDPVKAAPKKDDTAARRAAAKKKFDALVEQLSALVPKLADEDAAAISGQITGILQQMRRLAPQVDAGNPSGNTTKLVDTVGQAIASSLTEGQTDQLMRVLDQLSHAGD